MRTIGALIAAALLLASGRARAADPLNPSRLPPPVIYNYGENETPRIAAMGGALRSLGNGTSSLYINPADLVETRVYHLEAFAQGTPETGRQVYGGTVVDSVTGRLAGGVSFTGAPAMDTDGLKRAFIDARVGLAYPIGDHFFIGVAGRYVRMWQEGLNAPFGTTDPVAGGLVQTNDKGETSRDALVNTVNFDVGMTVKAGDSFYISAVGQNLTFRNNGLLPTLIGGGFAFGNENLSLEADGVADLSSYATPKARVMAGGEYLFADRVPVRLGYRWDHGADMHWLSAGVGYVSPAWSVEGAVRRSLSDPGATMMVLSVAYHLESSGVTRAQASEAEQP